MGKRQIIKIDEEKCNGCGQCIPNCPEGALQVIDGKARLVSDLFCDGLGACIGYCPLRRAITIEERQAQEYDEKKVMANVVKQGDNVIKAHLQHLKEHGQIKYLKQALGYLKEKGIKNPLDEKSEEEDSHSGHAHEMSGCPGSKMMDFREKEDSGKADKVVVKGISRLGQWPVQIMLVPVNAPYFDGADLLIAADCVPFAYADFHEELLRGKVLLVGCPKLDDAAFYQGKITQILKKNDIKSLTCAHMEVPCCFGLVHLLKSAIEASGKDIPFKDVTIGIRGDRLK